MRALLIIHPTFLTECVPFYTSNMVCFNCRLHAEYEADYENNDEEEEEITDDEDDSSEDEDRSHINGSNTKDMNDTESSSLEHQKSLSSPSSMPFCREAWGENSSVELETMKKSRRISFADEAQALSRSSPDGGLGSENICIRFRHSEDALIHTPTRVTSAKVTAIFFHFILRKKLS